MQLSLLGLCMDSSVSAKSVSTTLTSVSGSTRRLLLPLRRPPRRRSGLPRTK
ncbi:hypothetical protein L5515_007603 [Caenorhabditis briggsae]|uniref:Uncharacterized protein n=1 Tax=Caenorhabditis briggsae TaxID=6238 RepID=A0AAE9EZ31_CAEBR|nr:hypothetical protein L5515_007603 [Caenorhabditis briggsae]